MIKKDSATAQPVPAEPELQQKPAEPKAMPTVIEEASDSEGASDSEAEAPLKVLKRSPAEENEKAWLANFLAAQHSGKRAN